MRTPEIVVVGAGPAGLMAALSAAALGAQVILLDRDEAPGGQLVKQTHMFFGSKNQFAATRGIDIARILAEQVAASDSIELLLGATVLGYYPDGVILAEMDDHLLKLKPECLVVATGAAEKVLPFPGNDLPGVYGAGAVQTLMNVYGVRPGDQVVMVGAGNIGLIVSYQLLPGGRPRGRHRGGRPHHRRLPGARQQDPPCGRSHPDLPHGEGSLRDRGARRGHPPGGWTSAGSRSPARSETSPAMCSVLPWASPL